MPIIPILKPSMEGPELEDSLDNIRKTDSDQVSK